MKTSDNITVTNGRLKKALSTRVENIIVPQLNQKINKTATDAKIQVGSMTKFYPYLDKCEVDLDGELIICKILHRFSGELIDFYTPTGDEDYCDNLHEPCIIPREDLKCLVLDINDSSDERVMIGYFLAEEIIGFNPASQGNLKLMSVGATNQYWIKFGLDGLDIRSPETPVTNVGEFDSDMSSLEYTTREDVEDIIVGKIDLTGIYERLDTLQEEIDNLDPGGGSADLKDYVKKDDLIDNTKFDIDLNLNFGLTGSEDSIIIDMDIVDHIVNKRITP